MRRARSGSWWRSDTDKGKVNTAEGSKGGSIGTGGKGKRGRLRVCEICIVGEEDLRMAYTRRAFGPVVTLVSSLRAGRGGEIQKARIDSMMEPSTLHCDCLSLAKYG